MEIHPIDEIELKIQTQNMFNAGGTENVLDCVSTLQKCQIIILTKLNEILESSNENTEPN